ncbi:MAG: antitoxin Xre/MbcA/ParS toxin-binding domain-containing protein [Pseudomonadota bacterium]|nr:XRE family transcriptional regulator [Phenylobacterium sp. Root700]
MTKGQLAETAGLAKDTLQKAVRRDAPKTRARVVEMLEILSRLEEWAGGRSQAMAWYRAQPIAALDGRTAEALVKSGKAALVRDYLDHLALGGFA